jgi:hypothetical protein
MSMALHCGAFLCNVLKQLPVCISMKVRIKENSVLAKIAAAKMKADKLAIVFGHTIHLYNTGRAEFLNDRDWVCHEIKHVHQYKQHGYTGFIVKYLYDSIKRGYYNNRFEKEARDAECNRELLNGVEFV